MPRSLVNSFKRVVLRSLHAVVWPRKFAEYRECIHKGEIPSEELLKSLVYHWGNSGWSADAAYLRCLLLETLHRENLVILECGSGLTTILLGVVADRQSHQIISLEHHRDWQSRMTAAAQKNGISNVEILHAPLIDCGDFDWYDKKDFLSSDALIDLVICGGPPGSTRGARVGLPYVIGSKLRPGALVVMDDAHRPSEQAVISRWESDFGCKQEKSRSESHFTLIRF